MECLTATQDGSFREWKLRDSTTGTKDLRCRGRSLGTCFDQILPDSKRCDQKFVFFRTAIPRRYHKERMQTRSSARPSGIGQRTLQLGSPSGGVNFFNAICRLRMYEGSFSTRFSDLLFSTDSFVCAESVSAGVGLGSSFSVSIDPLQLINATVLSTAIILNSRQVGCTRSGY